MGFLLMKNSYGRRVVPELLYRKEGPVRTACMGTSWPCPVWVHCGVHCGSNITTTHRRILFGPLYKKETLR
jgi:hypothetical protein